MAELRKDEQLRGVTGATKWDGQEIGIQYSRDALIKLLQDRLLETRRVLEVLEWVDGRSGFVVLWPAILYGSGDK